MPVTDITQEAGLTSLFAHASQRFYIGIADELAQLGRGCRQRGIAPISGEPAIVAGRFWGRGLEGWECGKIQWRESICIDPCGLLRNYGLLLFWGKCHKKLRNGFYWEWFRRPHSPVSYMAVAVFRQFVRRGAG